MVEAINDRELDRLDQLVAPDIVRQSAATAGVVVTSLEQFKAFLRSDFAGVPDSVISIDIVFGNDEYVAMRAIYSGTQTGQVGPFPPSGKRVELPFMGILRIDEGRIAEMWVEWDNVFMLTQLGHFSPNGGESE
jgi:steroid delta-isomerase-like uncharacterized protein